MIEEKLTFINEDNDKSLDEDSGGTRFYKCPKCGSYHIVKNGTYARKTTVINEEVVITKIQKYICKQCNTSFKYLPLYLSSNNHLCVRFLLKVIISKGSINHLSKLFKLSRSTIRNIQRKYSYITKRLRLLINKYAINSYFELSKIYLGEFKQFLFCPSTTSANYLYLINQLS